MMNPSQRGMALIYKVGGTDLWGAILSCEGARDLVNRGHLEVYSWPWFDVSLVSWLL